MKDTKQNIEDGLSLKEEELIKEIASLVLEKKCKKKKRESKHGDDEEEDGQEPDETSDTPSVKLKESLSDEAYELKLFADNDSNLYSKSKVPIMKNLSKKFKKGNYNNTLAIKAWKLFVDKAAKAYGKEHGNNDGFKIFSPAVRKELAKEFADEWNIEMQAGNFHESVNEGKIKVGSIVKPNKGPHKGQDHEVIAMQGNGVYNITPINIHYTKIKYRLGAAGAKEKDLELVKESNEEADLLELNLSLDKFVDVAKGTKTKNKFFVFNNKGQVYHTAPTLDKAKKLAAEYKNHPHEMGKPTILDLTKGKIVEKDESNMNENKEVERITKIGKSMKVGDKTTFGVITKMGDDWLEFKAKDTPKTKIKFNQRKSGGRYVLSLLALAEEVVNENEKTTDISRAFTDRKDPLADAASKIIKQ